MLSLYYLGGMKSKEISRFLGVSPQTIDMRLSRARAKLKAALSPDSIGEEMITMMTTTFDEIRLQPGFTFHIVEAIKRTKIQAPPSKMTLPFGVSVAAGLIVLMLSFTVPYSPLYPIGQLIGSALPSQTQVKEDSVIPVDTIEITKIVSLSPEMADGDFGKKPMPEPTPMVGAGKWERKADMPTARENQSTAVVDSTIYVIGGWTGGGEAGVVSTVEAYNTDTDKWTKKAPMQFSRTVPATAVVNGKIYVFGGDHFHRPKHSTIEMYDPQKETWTRKADMLSVRFTLTASLLDNKVYLIGGSNSLDEGSNFTKIVEVYDPVADASNRKADMPTTRGYHTAN